MNEYLRMVSAEVNDAYDGLRVYDVLRAQMGLSDGCIRRAKRVEGGILLDGAPVFTNRRVETGQKVSLAFDGPGVPGSTTDLAPEAGSLQVLHADDDLLVVDKPAGLVMYPSPGHDGNTLANRVSGWLAARNRRCGIHAAHRLDRDTSGLAVFALNSLAKDRLQEQLHTGSFEREYLALCLGRPEPAEGSVEAPMGLLSRHPNVYGVASDGKPARTRYWAIGSWSVQGTEITAVRLRLDTGRTHQIRIHLAHIGHPLLGDAAYGSASPLMARAALHSWRLRLVHPLSGERLQLECAPPADLQRLMPDGGKPTGASATCG